MIEEFEFPNGAEEDLYHLETPAYDVSTCAVCGWPLPKEDWYCASCFDLAHKPLTFLPIPPKASFHKTDPAQFQAMWAWRNITRHKRCRKGATVRNNVMK